MQLFCEHKPILKLKVYLKVQACCQELGLHLVGFMAYSQSTSNPPGHKEDT